MNGASRLRVHVERLVVDGLPDLRADRLSEGLVAELCKLAVRGAPPIDIPDELVVDLEHDPETAGRALAAVVHARLIAESGHG